MKWIYSQVEPDPIGRQNHYGQTQRTVNFNVETLPEADQNGNKFRYQSVTLEPGVWDYSSIVSALIRHKYNDDAMTAIINNFLADGDSEEYKEEMGEMQSWRKKAKELAQGFLQIDPPYEVTEN